MSLEKFESVAEAIKAMTSKPSSEELLELYALYKQATVGDVNIEEAADADEEAKAKRSAWESKKGMSQDDAKIAYVEFAEGILAKNKPE